MSTSRLDRQQILDAFGITEDDIAALKALEDANGYTASKARAEREFAYFHDVLIPAQIDRIERHLAQLLSP